MRMITACEAAWRHLGYTMHDMTHTVVELKLQEPGEQFILVQEDEEKRTLQRAKCRHNSSQHTLHSVPLIRRQAPC